jgi:hypothetical protein
MISDLLTALAFSQFQPLTLTMTSTLKLKKGKKKINRVRKFMIKSKKRLDFVTEIWSGSHKTCTYICTYINAAGKNVTLQVNLRHNFCNIFKTKYKLYTVSWSACRRPSLHSLIKASFSLL